MEKIVQKIKKQYNNEIEVGIKYFALICVLNDIPITLRELQLLSFIATKGSISSKRYKQEFMSMFSTTFSYTNALVTLLTKKHLVVKKDGKKILAPQFLKDFSKDIFLQLNINAKETK